MDFSSFKEQVERAIRNNETVIFGCACSVVYSGRAESFLETGDRVIMIKSDNNLIVHQPHGTSPVNYMKAGADHSFIIDDGGLHMESTDEKRKESMILDIIDIHFLHSHPLQDGASITLQGSEKDMSDMIMDRPELIEDGFTPLSREEHTEHGFVDVFGHDKDNNLVIVECKRFTAGPAAVEQLTRYVRKLKRSRGIDHVRGILAAPSLTKTAERLLEEKGFEHRLIDPPNFHRRQKRQQASLADF